MDQKSQDTVQSEGISDEMLKIDRQLCFALYTASRATIDVYRPLLDELGITYPQYLVMLVLWEHNSLSVKEIGQILHLDSGTLSPLLKRLETATFIKRQRRANDERVVDILLTDSGRELKQRVMDIPTKFFCAVDLSLDEYTALITQLKKLVNYLSLPA